MFGVDYNGLYALFISLISGYPVGAKITRDLYLNGYIDSKTATKTAIISSTSGTSFIIGTVGSIMLNNLKFGLIIFISNFLAVIIYSFFYNLISKKEPHEQSKLIEVKQEKKPFLKLISSSAIDTIKGLLIVAFYITLFSLIIELFNVLILTRLPNISSFAKYVMSGIIEMTSGVKSLSIASNKISISLIAMLTGFSGLSIIMQSIEFLEKTKIKAHKFFIAKIFHAILSFIICYGLLCIF